ncbi:MAG: hypothetical protein WCB27_14725 [Thermoguttaceae bacterium]
MKRLLAWLLVALAVVLGVVVLGPMVRNTDLKSRLYGPSGAHLSVEAFDKIHNGMRPQEVTGILGNASEDHMGSMAGVGALGNGARFLVWRDGTMEVTVRFSQEGLVISKTHTRL